MWRGGHVLCNCRGGECKCGGEDMYCATVGEESVNVEGRTCTVQL